MTWKNDIKKKKESKYEEVKRDIKDALEENDTMEAFDLAMRTLGDFSDGFFGDIHDIVRKELGDEGLIDLIEAIAFGF
tara:strand:- start:473 stop:706 length:234 start_codon:yes stop_codon:yes gene_type:complete